MRLTTIPAEADAELWDPADPERFTALCGTQFLGTDDDGNARGRTREGLEQVVRPGWYAVRMDGSGDGQVIFMSPGHVGDGPGCDWRPAAG